MPPDVRDRIDAWSKAVAGYLLQRSVVFIDMEADDRPRVVSGFLRTASGTLVRVGARFFVFTAGHVARDLVNPERKTGWMAPLNAALTIPAPRADRPAFCAVVSGGDSEEDAAVLEVHPKWVEAVGLGGGNFLMLDGLLPTCGPAELQPFERVVIFGTPSVCTSSGDGGTQVRPLLFTSQVRGPDPNARPGIKSYAIKYEKVGWGTLREGREPDWMSPPHPEGMSGGSAWLIPDVRQFHPSMMKMFGVQLGVYREDESLRVGPIEHWVNILRFGFDAQLREALEQYLGSLGD